MHLQYINNGVSDAAALFCVAQSLGYICFRLHVVRKIPHVFFQTIAK